VIRDRRDEDLGPLCAILATSCHLPPGIDPRAWLEEHDAERSWVFDMAPVRVAPTKNVVGHVQIYRPPAGSSLLRCTDRPAGEVLAIGKLFVKPDTFEHGIGRHLLKESVKHVQRQGKLPVLDLQENRAFPKKFFERYGFREVPSGDDCVAPMVWLPEPSHRR
jgi:GNAT superfamily N-acetyltransferase